MLSLPEVAIQKDGFIFSLQVIVSNIYEHPLKPPLKSYEQGMAPFCQQEKWVDEFVQLAGEDHDRAHLYDISMQPPSFLGTGKTRQPPYFLAGPLH